MTTRSVGFVVGILSFLLPSHVAAQTLDEEVLSFAKEAVVSICGEFASGGSVEQTKVDGAVEAELSRLARLFVQFGVNGSGELFSEDYVGVLREDLGAELQDVRSCRLQVWSDVVDKLQMRSGESGANGIDTALLVRSGRELTNCKETQFFSVCIDSSRVRGGYVDVNLTVQNLTDTGRSLCQQTLHAFTLTQSGEKQEITGGRDCFSVVPHGIERLGYLFEHERDVGDSYDLTVIFSSPPTRFNFRDVK